MNPNERREGESFTKYRDRLTKQNSALAKRLKGVRVLWRSGPFYPKEGVRIAGRTYTRLLHGELT